MRRTVTYVKLQGTDAFLPGIGSFGNTLPPMSKKLDIKMFIDDRFPTLLFVQVGRRESFIPLANVQIAEIVPEASTEQSPPSTK